MSSYIAAHCNSDPGYLAGPCLQGFTACRHSHMKIRNLSENLLQPAGEGKVATQPVSQESLGRKTVVEWETKAPLGPTNVCVKGKVVHVLSLRSHPFIPFCPARENLNFVSFLSLFQRVSL